MKSAKVGKGIIALFNNKLKIQACSQVITLLNARSEIASKTVRPYVAKSYFKTYKSYDHMQTIRPISQNFNKILTFENLEK